MQLDAAFTVQIPTLKPFRKIHFTDRGIRALQPSTVSQVDYWDAARSPRGFGIRVSPSGTKSWMLVYRAKDEKTKKSRLRRFTFGRYPEMPLADARARAEEIRGNIAEGRDPLYQLQRDRQAEIAAESFRALGNEYLKEHAIPKKRSWREDKRILDNELLPKWGDFKAMAISRRDVKELLREIVERGSPIQANRTLALVRKVFNYAVQEEILDVNPAWKIPSPAKETPRERVLSTDELKEAWKAFAGKHQRTGTYLKLVLLTAQRPGEVLRMQWDELDLDSGWWTIPGSKTKNGLAHRVPLGATARALLEQLRAATKSRFVFASRVPGQPVQNVKKGLVAIRAECNVEFRTHDLRRTAASSMTSLGIPRLTVKKILNHVDSSVTAIYDRHSYDAEKKTALENWSQHLLQLGNEQP